MKRTAYLFFICITNFLTLSPVHAASSPTELVAALQKAIAAKDIAQADALVEWGNAPAMIYRFFRMSVSDCFADTCKIEATPITEEEITGNATLIYKVRPEGQVKIIASDGSGSTSMPFAKIDGQYKIVVATLTPDAAAEARSKADPKKVAEELDPDAVSTGTALPADGGEPAKAYREYLAAVARKDQKFLASSGSHRDRFFFGQAYKDKPYKAAITLDILQLESPKEIAIEGGFEKDGRAVLLARGTLGSGLPAAGAIALENSSGKWLVESQQMIDYQPAP